MNRPLALLLMLLTAVMVFASPALAHAAPPARAAPGYVPADCRGDAEAQATVVNIPGWDYRVWRWIQLDLPADVRVCNYHLTAQWGVDEVDFMKNELDELVTDNGQVIIVAYSMSAPYIVEVLDTWSTADLQPQVLDKLDLVLVAPAARVHRNVRGFVRRQAERWTHAWKVHFEEGVMRKSYLPEWNDLLDRTHLIMAKHEAVVDYSGIDPKVLQRLGQNVHTLSGRHVDMRKKPEITTLVHDLLHSE
jgi:hypothetical protein